MDPERSPYTPGAGRPPAELVGRDRQEERWRRELEPAGVGPPVPVALHGLRGIGRTVLLARFAATARARGWVVARVDARTRTSLRAAVGDALRTELADPVRPPAGAALRTALTTWDNAAPGPGSRLESDLAGLVEDLSATGAGVVLLVDEAQVLSNDDLTAVCTTARLAGRQGWPARFAVAGLPSLPRVLVQATVWPEPVFRLARLDPLEDAAAGAALVGPAALEGVTWDDDARALVIARAGGYPSFLQQLGHDTWNAAAGPRITLADARAGVARGRATLDDGLRASWDRTTPTEQRFLRAMAADGDAGSTAEDLGRRLRRPYATFASFRGSLVSQGLICAPGHAVVAFTEVGMAAFARRQPTPGARLRARAAGAAPGRRRA